MLYDPYVNAVRWILALLGAVVVGFALAVLAFVVTAADLGLRCLPASYTPQGLRIEIVSPHVQIEKGDPQPVAGDILVAIQRRPVRTFADFVNRMSELRNPVIPPGGRLSTETELSRHASLLPPLISKEYQDGELWVQVTFRERETGDEKRCWMLLQPLPGGEISLTFVWFVLQCSILLVGALASWTRPFDRSARLFFAMCIVVTGAFVGGYHWWIIAGALWLTVPFVICAVLVPVSTLHFFLVYPEPKPFMARWPLATKTLLYFTPVAAMLAIVFIVCRTRWLSLSSADPLEIQRAFRMLDWVVYSYLAVAAGYFAATIAALLHSSLTTRAVLIQHQVRWILWAGLLATLPVGYTLFLALTRQTQFALGDASVPMFAASILFMLAYAIGIVRYKLMLVDQILSRGMLHYVFSLAIAGVYSFAIASGTFAGLTQPRLLPSHAWSVFSIVVLAVLLLGWFRDRLQQIIDRRFFRDKYPIDRALSGMSEVGNRQEPESLAERLLSSLRDVLGVERACVYLRDQGEFNLGACFGMRNPPRRLAATENLLRSLQADASVQRHDNATGPAAEVQPLLNQFNLHLVHALETNGEIVGIILLGPRRNGASFSADDLTFLTAVGQIGSVALNSVRVHQTLARMNDDLRLKADKIGEQQRMIAMLQSEITTREAATAPTSSTAAPAEPEAVPLRRELIKGNSPAIRLVLETVRKVSSSEASVLVRGESGTGKELLARAIHENGPRAKGPLVSVHCAALSPGLLESELFGHVKGAFTGAHRDRTGRFEMASGGTLFLDEIGDISLETQVKLLRVLQERSFEPVGGSRTVNVDVRLIAATHQNLERLISEGKFREDLFYRLNVISITLPPLRERPEDVVELTLHFLTRAAERLGKTVTHVEDDALHVLLRYAWPGNIRELENVIERAVVLTDGPGLQLTDLPPEMASNSRWTQPVDLRPVPLSLSELPQAAGERQQLLLALDRARGNKAEAARLLGIPRSTFFSKLKKHAIS